MADETLEEKPYCPVDEVFDNRSHFDPTRWETLIQVCDDLKVEGCIVEVGCHQCGTLAWLSQRFPDRDCYGYDRFEEGMTAPSPKDRMEGSSYHEGALGVSFQHCMDYLQGLKTKYRMGPVGLIKGDVRDTMKSVGDLAPIALAVVDLNLYEPTKIALRGLDGKTYKGVWDYLAVGGIIVVDDVGFPGIDEALSECGIAWERHGYMAVMRK